MSSSVRRRSVSSTQRRAPASRSPFPCPATLPSNSAASRSASAVGRQPRDDNRGGLPARFDGTSFLRDGQPAGRAFATGGIIPRVSHTAHRAAAPGNIRCSVVTVSDTRTEETDRGGGAIVELLAQAGHDVAARAIVPDDPGRVKDAIQAGVAAADVDVVITTGGTGITRRDGTYEVVSALNREAHRRLRRAVPRLELPGDRAGGDAEPRLRRPCRRNHRDQRARVRTRRAAGDDETDHSGARPYGPRGATVTDSPKMRPHPEDDSARRGARPRHCRRPADRAGGTRAPDRGERPGAGGGRGRHGRRAAVRSRRDGRVRGDRRDTFGAGGQTPRTLRCIESVHTGRVPTRRLDRGDCTQIATGAPMPEGADAVVMVEQTDREPDGGVRIFTPVYPGQHIGRRAADIAVGQALLARGDLLTPSPPRGDSRARHRRRRRIRPPRRRHPVDGQRDRRAGATARTGSDLRHQPVYGRRRRRAARRPGGRLPDGGRHPRRPRRRARRLRRRRRARLLRRQLGRRARPHAGPCSSVAARCCFTASPSSRASRPCSG